MAKSVTEKSSHQTTTLFHRILTRLIFPLFCLSLIFMAIQLTNRITSMNEYYKVESRLVFETIRNRLEQVVTLKQTRAELAATLENLTTLSSPNRPVTLQLFDLVEQRPLLEKDASWTQTDKTAVDKSLLEKTQGKPYFLRVDKTAKQIIAYIPVRGPAALNQIWVARVRFPLTQIQDVLRDSVWSLVLILFFVLLTGIFIGRGLAATIVKPMRSLNRATQEILAGRLGRHVKITTGDEIETLAHTFNQMSTSLKSMKEQAEDANPLTQLPGNQGIFREIKRRIHAKQKFVIFHADLDRFKAYNDYMGLGKGDEAIKAAANLFREAVHQKGSQHDFVGHQGGDDYVLVLGLQHARDVAEYIVGQFNEKVVKPAYPKEDYERGYTLGVDRRAALAEGAEDPQTQARIPLMAVSLAGVSNVKKDFADYFDCLGRAVAVKKEAKKIIENSYIIKEE